MPFGKRLTLVCIALAAAASVGLVAPAAAAESPWNVDKPIRLVVPWAPGGAVDGTSRALASALGQRLKQPVIVENKSGASGLIGGAYAAASPPDGYTFFMGNVDTQVVNPILFTRVIKYNPGTSFDPVIEVGRVPMAVVTRTGINVHNAQDFMRVTQAKPGALSYGTWGVGSTAHLAFALLEQRTGASLNHLPYQGATPAYGALLGGHLEFVLAQVSWASAAAKEGKVEIVAVTSKQRTSLDPAIPTMAEIGFKDYAVEQWVGMYAPKGVPVAMRQRMNDEVNAWLATPEARAALKGVGVEAGGGTPDRLSRRQAEESTFWQDLIKARNITVDTIQ